MLAVGAYAFLTRDQQGLTELGAIASKNTEDEDLRNESATAFARLASSPDDAKVLMILAKEYLAASAKKRKCDLIIMASHGRSGLSAFLLGSETTKVLTHTTIPVLVCR